MEFAQAHPNYLELITSQTIESIASIKINCGTPLVAENIPYKHSYLTMQIKHIIYYLIIIYITIE